MTHSKRLSTTTLDRLKLAMKVLAHLSLLFLIGIFTYKTPVFAQEPYSSTGISLQIFVPFEVLENAIEKAITNVKLHKKRVRLPKPIYFATITSTVQPKNIELNEEDGRLRIAADLDGKATILQENYYDNAKILSTQADPQGKVKLLVNLKAQEDWSIDFRINTTNISVDFDKAITALGSSIISLRVLMESLVRQRIEDKTKKPTKGNSISINHYAMKISSALKTFVKGLTNDTTIKLHTTPRSLVAATQPYISNAGIYFYFEVTTKKSTSTTQLAPKLSLLDAPTNKPLNLTISTEFDFAAINIYIKKFPQTKTIIQDNGIYTYTLEEVMLASTDQVVSTNLDTVAVKLRIRSSFKFLNPFWLRFIFQAPSVVSDSHKTKSPNPRQLKNQANSLLVEHQMLRATTIDKTVDIEYLAELTLPGTEREINFENIGSAIKSIKPYNAAKAFYHPLTINQIRDLVQNSLRVSLYGILQDKIGHTGKNIKITTKVLPTTNMKLIHTGKSCFLVDANVFATLKFEVTGFDNP